MAYTHTQYEVDLVAGASFASTGDKGEYAPGYIPHIIRAVAVVCKTNPSGGGVLKLDKRPTAGSDTNRGDGDVAVVNIPDGAQGDVIYVDGLNEELKPGEEVVAQVTTADAGLTDADIKLYVEPRWEQPGNIAAMKESS